VLAVDTTEASSGDGGIRTHIDLGASEVLGRLSDVPGCGRVESKHHTQGARGYSPLSSPVLSARDEGGGRPDSNRYREVHHLGCCRYTQPPRKEGGRNGDDRTRTGDLSPDKRVLSPLSYAPEWRGWDSNPRSRAHEAREDSRSSTALCRGLAGRSRTCDLRCPRPAGWPTPLQPDETRTGTRSLPSGPGRSRTCTTPIKSRPLSHSSYEAANRRDRQGSNLRRLAFQTSALPLSYGHMDGRSWSRTRDLSGSPPRRWRRPGHVARRES
jgi:hypothetical protein